MRSTLGQRFLQARLTAGARRGQSVTQAVAGAAVGVSGAAIGGYEADKSEPALSVIEALAEFYGVRKPWLAFNEGAMLEGDTGVVRDKPIPSRDNLAGTSVPTAKRRKA